MPMKILTIATACLVDETGRLLTVRKRGTLHFMLPGGKAEPGETPRATVLREVAEELGLVLEGEHLELLGLFEARAANEPDHWVRADVFVVPVTRAIREGQIRAQAEIEALQWIDPLAPPDGPLAPLLRDRILPVLSKRLAVTAF